MERDVATGARGYLEGAGVRAILPTPPLRTVIPSLANHTGERFAWRRRAGQGERGDVG